MATLWEQLLKWLLLFAFDFFPPHLFNLMFDNCNLTGLTWSYGSHSLGLPGWYQSVPGNAHSHKVTRHLQPNKVTWVARLVWGVYLQTHPQPTRSSDCVNVGTDPYSLCVCKYTTSLRPSLCLCCRVRVTPRTDWSNFLSRILHWGFYVTNIYSRINHMKN